jgi:signal transduction histidine kinase
MRARRFTGDNGQVSVRTWPRGAISFLGSTEPRTALSRQAIIADTCLALAAALVVLAGANFDNSTARAAAVLTTASLAARRRAPLAAFWVILTTVIAAGGDNTIVTIAATVIAAYCAVVYSPYRGRALLSLPLAGLIITAAFQDTAPPLPRRLSALVILLAITAFGNAVRVWRARARESGTRLLRVQAEHEAATRRALELERARIASELHDVVTHNVSVMVVQAGAARQVLGAGQDEARSALLAVEASGRTAMAELQHMLGLLCVPGELESGSQADGDARDQLRPLPGLGQLTMLTDRMTAAGLDVELRVIGVPWSLSPGRDLAAYRVIQEALTNVLKHAGSARAAVTLDYRRDWLMLEVTDDGPRCPAEPSPHPRERQRPAALPGTGRGLIGLRERVMLSGGEFDAGRRPRGGWRVMARFPAQEPLGSVTGATGATGAAGAAALPDPART